MTMVATCALLAPYFLLLGVAALWVAGTEQLREDPGPDRRGCRPGFSIHD